MKVLPALLISLMFMTSCKMSYKKTHLAAAASAIEPGIYLNTRVCLESAYDNSFVGSREMYTSLNSLNLIPRVTPYESTAPWYHYSPNDLSLAPNILDPNGDADYSDGIFVDWVLIEVYQDINGVMTYMDGQSALIKFDGTIYDTSGYQGVLFPDLSPGNYYINVIHRNHLSIGSANAVTLNKDFDENTYNIDFTDSATPYLDEGILPDDPFILLGTTNFKCLKAGDLNGDLSIDITDANEIWTNIQDVVSNPDPDTAVIGYLNSDVDFDGVTQREYEAAPGPIYADSNDFILVNSNVGDLGSIHTDEN